MLVNMQNHSIVINHIQLMLNNHIQLIQFQLMIKLLKLLKVIL